MHKRGLCLCLSVCVSVAFLNHVKTNKDIVEIFLPSGSHTILAFPHQTEPPNGGVECRWGRQKSLLSLHVSRFSACY